ncbi:MAG: hypothetical protein GY862_27140 [Gammaproteobacteria bacterium]|nr:hypothetical protein [Gammaproteobacteria bacterium]MCP5013873.1 hypothetical protein [Ketobacter sp.]
MSYTQSAVRITSELSDASIKPEHESQPFRISAAWVVLACVLSHVIVAVVL